MRKQEAVKLFGKTQQELADAMGVSKSLVSQWPDPLPASVRDRVLGAAVRLGKLDARNINDFRSELGDSELLPATEKHQEAAA